MGCYIMYNVWFLGFIMSKINSLKKSFFKIQITNYKTTGKIINKLKRKRENIINTSQCIINFNV